MYIYRLILFSMSRNALKNILSIHAFVICLIFSNISQSQGLSEVSGTIISSEDNKPLQGVSVILKNTSRGTNTNAEGEFKIPMTAQQQKDGTLVFSFTGMLRQEIKINGRSNIRITLEQDAAVLNDVIVTS